VQAYHEKYGTPFAAADFYKIYIFTYFFFKGNIYSLNFNCFY